MKNRGLGSLYYNVANNAKIYGDKVIPDRNDVNTRLSMFELANALGGSHMSGDAGDYVYFDGVNSNNFGHMGDAGKLPWHPTFSNGSVFATNAKNKANNFGLAEGGEWFKGGDNLYQYTPSNWQLSQPRYLEGLQRYYENEKGRGIDKVKLPMPYDSDKLFK
jgi:hypothetical protein